jgi:hypothetical protein
LNSPSIPLAERLLCSVTNVPAAIGSPSHQSVTCHTFIADATAGQRRWPRLFCEHADSGIRIGRRSTFCAYSEPANLGGDRYRSDLNGGKGGLEPLPSIMSRSPRRTFLVAGILISRPIYDGRCSWVALERNGNQTTALRRIPLQLDIEAYTRVVALQRSRHGARSVPAGCYAARRSRKRR